MTYEALLEKINFNDSAFNVENALLAVVELHKPEQHKDINNGNLYCSLCRYLCHSHSGLMCDDEGDGAYPCPTIQAIEKALS